MAAATITQSVIAKFAASDVATEFSASSGLWLEQIPEQISLPFIAFEHGGEQFEYTTERDYSAMGTYTFTIFAVTIAETERLAKAVMAVFDAIIKSSRSLDFATSKVTDWEKTSYRIGVEGLRKEDNTQIGRATFDYRYKVLAQLP